MNLLRPGFDSVVRRALLGVLCRDAVAGRVVSDGLQLVLLDRQRPALRQPLLRNGSGVFVLHDLPGWPRFGEDFSAVAGAFSSDDSPPVSPTLTSPPGDGRYTLQATDTLGRFLPWRCPVDLPGDGLLPSPLEPLSPGPSGDWGDVDEPALPLFPAPSAPLPAAHATVRTELHSLATPGFAARPMCWAWCELWLGSQRLAAAPADAAGRVLLLAPWPRPREGLRRASPAQPVETGQWTVTLRAFWHPAQDPDVPPDLSTLALQPEVELLQRASPRLPLPAQTLLSDVALTVRSDGVSHLIAAV
jgi:hypothetical protein